MKQPSGKVCGISKLKKAADFLHVPASFDYYSSGIRSNGVFMPDNIHIWVRTGDLGSEPMKQHCRYVLKIVLAGSNVSLLDEHSLKLNAGQALVIFPHQLHCNMVNGKDEETPEMLLLNFLENPQYSSSLESLKNRVITLTGKDIEILMQMLESVKEHNGLDHGDTGILLAWLLNRFCRRMRSSTGSGSKPIEEQIDDFIRSNFKHRLTLKMICDNFKISRTTLQRIFAAKVQKRTPGAQIRFLKLQQSLEWVMHSENSIKEIALFCGYSDQFTFSRAFKKMFNRSPMQLRKENTGQ